MNNKQQLSWWYKDYQICFYPREQTLRCSDTYSQMIVIWNREREIVGERHFNTDEIFWDGVETVEKMQDYCRRWIDMDDWEGVWVFDVKR